MHIFERLFSLFVYAILLVVVANGLCTSKHKRSVKIWLCFYLVVLTVLGFVFIPHQDTDLYRLLGYMHSWASLSFENMVRACGDSSTPASIVYFWLIGQFGDDRFLPAVTAFIGFGLLFNCLFDYSMRIKARGSSIAIALFSLMSSGVYFYFISGIRNLLAFAIVFWCIYREVYKGKSILIHVPLYAIASLLHPAALAMVLFRIAMMAFQGKGFTNKKAGYLVIVLVLGVGIFVFGHSYIDAMFEKGERYVTLEGYTYFWEYLIHAILVVFLVYLARISKRTGLTDQDLDVWKMIIALVPLCFVAFPLNYALFSRLATFLGLFVFIPVLQIFEQGTEDPRFRSSRTVIVLFALTLFVVSCARGNMSGYMFLMF